jgi:hypothetical protein
LLRLLRGAVGGRLVVFLRHCVGIV